MEREAVKEHQRQTEDEANVTSQKQGRGLKGVYK